MYANKIPINALPMTVITESEIEFKVADTEDGENALRKAAGANVPSVSIKLSLTSEIIGYTMYPTVKKITTASKNLFTDESFFIIYQIFSN